MDGQGTAVDVKHKRSRTMKHVDAAVDMQFAPVEEQLGYNLHQEAKLAKHEAMQESARAGDADKSVVERQKEMGIANEIQLAAKNADKEAQLMKDAVEKAKKEHREAEHDTSAVFQSADA